MLRNSRALLDQTWVRNDLEAPRFETLRRVADLFRTQVMVDEATDFSPLQLACMEALTSLQTRSFFACGDFNQRITATGIRSMAQLQWVSSRIKPEKINVVYRQSRLLNEFAGQLLAVQGGDLDALGELPPESTHDGVSPVLLEGADQDAAAAWIAERIAEVERAVQTMPTIAVLVNSEAEVRPMARQLNACLEASNLKAVPCDDGQSLGEGTDVRVFDVQHIKGLEFEAVFFVGIDQLAEQKPELFDRFLYVGATRAATYLGLVCQANLPTKLNALRPQFGERWDL
jgi:DNA helicase IV